MSKEFLEAKTGSSSISLAIKQQEQLAYFTQSSIQEEVNITYLEQWANRKFMGSDMFLNWVKAILKTENFLSFFKHYRQPLASARLVNNKLRNPLRRVFYSEDYHCNYFINGEAIESPELIDAVKFNDKLFNELLFRHNDIIVHDLEDINKPFRSFIPIQSVVAIESSDSIIHKIAYTACIDIDGIKKKGYLYMDSERYAFYDTAYNLLLDIPHDLGQCPADYVAGEPFSDDDVVRKSIFSYVREEFEEYVFLKTLQRMTEPNGAIPVVSTLKVNEKSKSGSDKDTDKSEPMSSGSMGSQEQQEFIKNVVSPEKGSPFQAGSVVSVPAIKKNDGSIDMDFAKNFLTFHYIDVDILEYIKTRIKEIEQSIILSVLGDYSEQNESAKNELQVQKSYTNKEDQYRWFAKEITRVRNLSDYKLLALKHGADNVVVDYFQGSDFFLETEQELYDRLEKSPNTIERKNILVRLTQNRNKFSPEKAKREKILCMLLPFVSDKDFDTAKDRGVLDDITVLYQTMFSKWIDLFETQYGNVTYFWDMFDDVTDTQKITLMNNLIINLIRDYYEQTEAYRAPKSVQSA